MQTLVLESHGMVSVSATESMQTKKPGHHAFSIYLYYQISKDISNSTPPLLTYFSSSLCKTHNP